MDSKIRMKHEYKGKKQLDIATSRVLDAKMTGMCPWQLIRSSPRKFSARDVHQGFSWRNFEIYRVSQKKIPPFDWKNDRNDKTSGLFDCTTKFCNLQLKCTYLAFTNCPRNIGDTSSQSKNLSAPKTRGFEKGPNHDLISWAFSTGIFNFVLLIFTFEKNSTLRFFNCSWNRFPFEENIVPHITMKKYLHPRRGKGADARLFWRCGTSLLFSPHFSSICLIRVVSKRL